MSRNSAIPLWTETEISFLSEDKYQNGYLDTQPWVNFIHESGLCLRRPMFWDGDNHFRVRFAPTREGKWAWETRSDHEDAGLAGKTGSINCSGTDSTTAFRKHGFWSMPHGGRNLVHADGTPSLIIADTAWALPWRATDEQCSIYAQDRQSKGFNAALLMTVQPDCDARGPRDRTQPEGFDVGFEDLSEGSLKQLNPAYFQQFDRLVRILLEHGILPVYQPVFHGYGWKGKRVAGNVVSAPDYARYCRYLVARYGARPAIYLIGGDGDGYAPGIGPAGKEVEKWDDYQQPAGIHYCPHSQFRAHQDQKWLDFQWCQTGHGGLHLPERVADMWRNHPPKGVANGEPTYENIGRTGNGAGWWQGHEAWNNLCAGGTMGVFYGAGSLWQWKLSPDEPGHEGWCTAPGAGWREALDFEGSRYPGIVQKILEGHNFNGMYPCWWYGIGARCLVVDGEFLLAYLEKGGDFQVRVPDSVVPRSYKIYDPKTGEQVGSGEMAEMPGRLDAGGAGEPRVVVFSRC